MELRRFRSLLLSFAWAAMASAALAQTTPAPDLDPDLEQTFRQADSDRNGAIDRNEAIRAKLSLSEKETFDGIDRDRNGLVTLFELGDALQARIRDWASGVESADRDGDGELSEEEARSASSLSQIFGRADANRDGKLNQEEYETFSRRNLYGNVDLPSVAPNLFEKRF
jgi:Ca2+-binding EF-hand superfamily protein